MRACVRACVHVKCLIFWKVFLSQTTLTFLIVVLIGGSVITSLACLNNADRTGLCWDLTVHVASITWIVHLKNRWQAGPEMTIRVLLITEESFHSSHSADWSVYRQHCCRGNTFFSINTHTSTSVQSKYTKLTEYAGPLFADWLLMWQFRYWH